jgi:tripeptide aminopeptidase
MHSSTRVQLEAEHEPEVKLRILRTASNLIRYQHPPKSRHACNYPSRAVTIHYATGETLEMRHLEQIEVNQERLIEYFMQLARQNTPPRHEAAAMKVAESWLRKLGFEFFYDDAGDKIGGEIGNLIAFKQGNIPDAPSIFFSSHFDTVEPTPGLEPRVDGPRIVSDGTTLVGADDKSGLAAIFEAMTILDEQQLPHGDIQLLLTICEEIGLVGAKYLDPKLIKAKYGFVLDCGPPIGSTIYQAPYHEILEVHVHGRSAHAGAEPENGVSAIRIAALAITRMKLGRIDHETTANVGIINGGTATNIIAGKCYLKCESRSRDKAKVERQTAVMVEALHTAAQELGGTIEIDVNRAYDGYEHSLDSPVLQIAEKATEAIGLEHILQVTGGGADANFFNLYGIPTAVIACAMNNIHRHDEYLVIDDLVKSAQQVVSIVKTAAQWTD